MRRSRLSTGVVAGGFAGSLLVALAGADLLDRRPVRWWFHPVLPGGHDTHLILLLAGLAILSLAWLALGRASVLGGLSLKALCGIAVLWALPLALGPALFSRDLFSYLAQGLIVHTGLDPYARTPAVLAHVGHGDVLAAVSPFWRHTPAPYGPGFLGLAALVAAAAPHNLVLGALLLRLPALAGVALMAAFVLRLARARGGDPRRALWLAVASPLVLVELIGAAHNDALMAGLLVAGVALAAEERFLAGVALCALGATVKLPALLGALFILAAAARGVPGRRLVLMARGLGVGAAVLAAVSLASGLGAGWLTGGVLSTPARVRLAITPATGLGVLLADLLHALGSSIDARALELRLDKLVLILPATLIAVLLWRVRARTVVAWLGLALLALVAGGPAAWPWYACWGLGLLAALPEYQRLRAWPLLLVVPVFLIHPDGRVVLPLASAPWVLLAYLALVLIALRQRLPGLLSRRPRLAPARLTRS